MVLDENFIYVLDIGLQSIFIFDHSGNLDKTLSSVDTIALQNPQFIEISKQDGNLFIIDMNKNEGILYRYSVDEDKVQIIYKEEGLKTVREENHTGYLWVSINNQQKAKLLQLSPEGLRLKSLDGFGYINDFRINRYNGGLLVADPGKMELLHIRQDGTLIGKYPETIFPLKVYNQ